ncbi:hypothetical protein QBC45DRAFT_373937 [Copromyces sp. CBS 386.78]|nr:hypothetical protein QBC45DRAFT_373937 [Copromyces sp. CBS 386.78]
MADNGPTLDNVEGFVAELEAAAAINDPRLHVWWEIIILLNDNLVSPGTGVIRPFNAYYGIPAQHRTFAERAYRWLRMHHFSGTTRYALARIGPTKPGLVAQTRDGMMRHELSRARRPTRVLCSPEQQAFPAKITSETMVWATDGALKSITAITPRPETLQDIPHTFGQMLPYVRLVADALSDRSEIIDKKETSRQVRLVKCTSGTVFEDTAWFLVVSTPTDGV